MIGTKWCIKIYILLLIGCIGPGILSIFWKYEINGLSWPFYIIYFIISIVDCTSSVTFTPFMASIQSTFLSHYFIGEGFSGLFPALIGSVQGAGSVTCVNGTTINHPPRFSVEIFFIIVSCMGLR